MPRAPVLVVLAVMATALLAGCTGSQSDVLLFQTVEVGERLYSWGDQDFTSGDRPKTMRADLIVPPGIEAVGVSFTGQHKDGNGSATLEVTDGQGRRLFLLNATEGRADDLGEIQRFWKFQRSYGVSVGSYGITMVARSVGPVDFRIHGIEARDTAVERSFEVHKGGGVYEVRLLLDGWGRAPTAMLVGPDNATTPLLLDSPEGQAVLHIEPPRGAHRIVIDTTGFGGRVTMRVAER